MEQQGQWDFLGQLAEDERAICQAAYYQGLTRCSRFLLDRLGSFYALLELELESSPTGQVYHREGAVALQHLQKLLADAIGGQELPANAIESFHFQVFVAGVVARIQKVGLAQVELVDTTGTAPQGQVTGHLYLLQQLLFALPYVVASAPSAAHCRLQVTLSRADYPAEFFQHRQSSAQPGPYFVVTVTHGTHAAPHANDLVTIPEKLALGGVAASPGALLFCLGAAQAHGGELLTGRGEGGLQTLVWMLPRQDSAGAAYRGAATPEENLTGKGTILLVDDEDIIWDVVIDMLQDLGYTVILAANGRECVEIYRDNPGQIDLVLLDMVMPEMNGRQAFFALKELDPKVHVLLQSGYVAEEDAREVLDAGARGFLRKPYRMADLARRIRDILKT